MSKAMRFSSGISLATKDKAVLPSKNERPNEVFRSTLLHLSRPSMNCQPPNRKF
jgi:hypothetical protein